MKAAIDFAVFALGVLIVTLMILAFTGHHSEVLKMEFKEIQPYGRPGI